MRYLAVYALLFLSLGFSGSATADDSLQLTLTKAGSLEPEATSQYFAQALHLALSKTGSTSETIQINYHPSYVNRERARLLVKQGILDVIWSSSNKEREAELTAIRFNLLRGINEYRLLLIRAHDQPRFDAVKTLMDLQKFRIGSGTHWSDTDVYRFNGLPVVASYAYEPMFRMLKIERFDYMARSVQEVHYELERYGKAGLAIEENLVIHYPQPIYFFVSKDKGVLAERIKRGLGIAQKDGSLDKLFFATPNFRNAWDEVQQLKRKTIELKVPE